MFISSGKTKRRSLIGPTLQMSLKRETAFNSNVYVNELGKQFLYRTAGAQVTESDGNRWPLPSGAGLQDFGSEFYTRKEEVLAPKLAYTSLVSKATPANPPGTYRRYRYEGQTWIANGFRQTLNYPNQLGPDLPLKYAFADLSSSRAALEQKGTKAIAAVQPGNQIAELASFVGELMQDVPNVPGVHLWEARLRALETVAAGAGEFLNYVFGVAPTIDDMGDFLKASHKIDTVIDQFIRDSGRVVRREFTFPKERSETEEVLTGNFSPVGSYTDGSSNGNLFAGNLGGSLPVFQTIRHRTVERETWFSGAFTYYLPHGYDTQSERDRRKLMAKLFGAEPDLNTLWQLTPWSWAIDWFSNTSSFVKNLQGMINYGTILRYGYVMEKTTVTDRFTAGALVNNETHDSQYAGHITPPYPTISPVVLRTTVKKRIKANPFGFGISWDGLSPIQLAIAAALGITRVVK